jgi:hypothetical protein
MTDEQMSKRTDRALHRAFESVVLTQFPNPERNDCPGIGTLRQIAKKRISMLDRALEHVGSCSACFSELTEIRRDLHRRKWVWSIGTAGTAAVLLALLLMYFGIGRAGNREREAVQPIPSQSQPKYEVALLDLRNASSTRAAQSPGSITGVQPLELPRGLLALTLQLPIGSEAGSYEVEIRKSNQPAIRNAKGQATIQNGITKLIVNLDTTSIQAGGYELGWQLAGFGWRYYPILVR